MTIDVLLPTQGEHTLLEASLASLSRQTFKDFRVLILDNSRSKGARQFIHRLSVLDKRFVCVPCDEILAEERNLGRILNFGLSLCQAEFVARQDDDDVSLPMRFERQLQAMHNGFQICGTQGIYVSSGPRFRYATCLPKRHNSMATYMWFGNPILHTSVIFHRTSVQELGGYSEDMKHGQDLDLWNRASSSNLQMTNLGKVLVMLTIRDSSITANTLNQGDRYSNSEILNRIQLSPSRKPKLDLYSLTVLLPSIRRSPQELGRVFLQTPFLAFTAIIKLGITQLKGRVFFFFSRRAFSHEVVNPD